MSIKEDGETDSELEDEPIDSEEDETDGEWEDNPTDFERLKPFDCPFCYSSMPDWYGGGCGHFVFSFEATNFEYLTVDTDFQKLALRHFRDLGYKVEELPCPLEPWAKYEDDDGDTHTLPSLDKLVPGLKLLTHMYHGPHGHGSWGIVVGFIEDPPQSFPPGSPA